MYVREEVFPADHPPSTGWVAVTGPLGGQVTLAAGQCDTLWALDMEGNMMQMTTVEVGAENKGVTGAEEEGWITL